MQFSPSSAQSRPPAFPHIPPWSRLGIDIPGRASLGGVFALQEMVIDLVKIAGTALTVFEWGWLEASGLGVVLSSSVGMGCIGFADLTVSFHRRLLLHQVGDMGVNVQRGR